MNLHLLLLRSWLLIILLTWDARRWPVEAFRAIQIGASVRYKTVLGAGGWGLGTWTKHWFGCLRSRLPREMRRGSLLLFLSFV
jgi:hypothetical protein